MLFLVLYAGFTGLQKGVLGKLPSQHISGHYYFFCYFFKKGLRFTPFICIAVACLHCFYVFRASILIFYFSFSHLRSLSFPFAFEDFFLANLSKMIPASICQDRVTLELQD